MLSQKNAARKTKCITIAETERKKKQNQLIIPSRTTRIYILISSGVLLIHIYIFEKKNENVIEESEKWGEIVLNLNVAIFYTLIISLGRRSPGYIYEVSFLCSDTNHTNIIMKTSKYTRAFAGRISFEGYTFLTYRRKYSINNKTARCYLLSSI